MTFRFSRHMRVLSLALFFSGVVSASLAFALRPTKVVNRRPAKGFTIVTKETITLDDPKWQSQPQQADYVITTRYQKSDGTWKEVRTAHKANGNLLRKNIQLGIPGRGVYEIDKDRLMLNFISSMPPKETTSFVAITDGHDHPNFLKDEVVSGYRTYALHYTIDKDGSYEDEYYAPDLDGYPIRSVKSAPYGNSVTEVVTITLGDPDASIFAPLPNWVVNYEQYESKIQALIDDGKQETAEALRRELQKQIGMQVEGP